jgi:multiple sugar transport system substrate-binding protein
VPAPPPVVAEPRFSLADIPAIKNKRPISIIVESEGGMRLMPPVFKAFKDHTGVDVKIDTVLFAAMYPKINVELVAGTGAYDIVIVESSSTNEWARYLYSMEELAKQFDPGGVEALRKELKYFHPTLLRTCSTKDKVLMGIPYDNYTQTMMYRVDVWENPIEKKAFKARYGYELTPPTDWRQLRDQAEFFTRKKGDLLKGETLGWDIYGMAFEAGKFNINDEISANLWGMGGYWADAVRDKEAKIVGWRITEQNKLLLQATLEIMKSWLPYSPPGVRTYYWEHVATDFIAGRIMMTPHTFGCCILPWASDVEDVVPGARIGAAETIGRRGYVGCFHLAVPRASKNPEAAYWLIRQLTSAKYSLEWGEGGAWGSCQLPVLTDPRYYKEPRTARYLPWVNKTLDAHLPFVDNYVHFNSSAMGRLYEEQIQIGGDVMAGLLTPKEGMERWVKVFIEIETKFGDLPILK